MIGSWPCGLTSTTSKAPTARATSGFRSDTFPGYHWLFPTGGGSANLGVGMLAAAYPQSSRNLRDMLMRLIDEDAALRNRLRGARMRGKVLGHPLTTYNPRLPLIGDRVMLLGDAAGLINPLNGEGIQYALHSARWAADVAADRLAADRLDAASLEAYQQRVQQSLRTDMALSRLIVQLIRNRNLNHVWLGALRSIASRARTDPDYAHHARLRPHRPDPGRQHGRHRRGRPDLRAGPRVPAGRRVMAAPQPPPEAGPPRPGRVRRPPGGTRRSS